MAVLIGVLLAILVIAVVVYPFVKARFQPRYPLTDASPAPAGLWPDRVDPGGRETMIYEEIRTLQLEHELGSIDESEYEEQLRAYRLQAAATLREQERTQQEIDLLMEKEIMAAREAIRSECCSPEGKGDDRPI